MIQVAVMGYGTIGSGVVEVLAKPTKTKSQKKPAKRLQ